MRILVSFLVMGAIAFSGRSAMAEDNCNQKAYKLLVAENKKCEKKFGKGGSKNRSEFNKCKYEAKGKYREADKKCK